MATTAPTPSTWTLRLKYHRSTILLYVDPLQSFVSIKGELLRALKQTHSSGCMPTGASIPSDVSDVILGEPEDIHDLSKGWKHLQSELKASDDDAAGDSTSSGKKKKGQSSWPEDCPSAAGIKDGGVLAFRFRSDKPSPAGIPGLDDEANSEWDVVLLDLEDTGETDAGIDDE